MITLLLTNAEVQRLRELLTQEDADLNDKIGAAIRRTPWHEMEDDGDDEELCECGRPARQCLASEGGDIHGDL
jgi:hypothetical protein